MAGPPGAPPPSRGEKDQVLAAFWIHMFPIGHLPVASNRPARQLPPPPEELDYAAGLRFEPADHPKFHLVDGSPRLAELKAAIEHRAAVKAAADAAPIPYPADTPSAYYPPRPGYPPPAEAPGSPAAGYQVNYPAEAPAQQPGYPAAQPVTPAAHAVGYPSPDAGYPANYPAEAGQYAAPGYSAEPAGQPSHQPEGADAKTIPNLQPVRPGPGLPAADPTVATILDKHDPLAGGNERDWDRRYLVRLGSVTAQGISPEGLEYNWPTSEQYPEGGSDKGDPEVLDKDTIIDRFGSPEGRVFAEDATTFAQRSLPPAYKDLGYRRYRVTKPLPVWRAVSAAWFGQTGGGVRFRTTHSATELVALGYLEELL